MKLEHKNTKEKDIKIEEKSHFDQFAHLANLDVINVRQPKPPDPDVIFEYNGLTVGLEIQKLFVDNYLVKKSSKLQEAESLRNKVIQLAVEKVKNYIPWPFEAHVTFNDNSVNPKKVTHLSECLAEIMIESLKNIKPTEDLKVFQIKNQDDNLNLESISFYITTKFNNHYYGTVASEFTRHLDPENIIKAIEKKEDKLKNYTQNCDEVWLLIVELGSLSSLFDNVQFALSLKYESNFEKIIFLRSFNNQQHYISTVAKKK